MSSPGFETRFDRLPETLPVFPLSGVLLLPRGRLPLNIFEPRYLNMIDDALAGDRLIGMIQPAGNGANPELQRLGCAGRIVSMAEEGHRYLITLMGICRFEIVEEVPTMRGYRRVVPNWAPYREDFTETLGGLDRPRLMAGLKAYFRARGLSTDWSALESAEDERLVTSLSMLCPFSPAEKQALLEVPQAAERAKLLTAFIEAAALYSGPDADGPRH